MRHERKLAILFADISGSTRVYRVLGDVMALDILARRIAILIDVTHECGGILIKTLGDEIMATFESADAAAAAAVRMQEDVTGTLFAEGPQIKIRVGFHFGPVLVEGDDVFGETVNIAARMASLAKGGQIVTTAASVALMSPSWQARTRRIEAKDVKGKGERFDTCEVVWRAEETTVARQGPVSGARRNGGVRLFLTFVDRRIELGHERPTLTIGRSDDNDLVIKHSVVSRVHARLEYQDGEFVLIDQSSNGTYVVSTSGANTYLRRNRCVLDAVGVIGLGEPPVPDSPVTVRYEIGAATASAEAGARTSDG